MSIDKNGMLNFTDRQFEAMFRKHWKWMAKTGLIDKAYYDAFQSGGLLHECCHKGTASNACHEAHDSTCFACGAAYQRYTSTTVQLKDMCDHCPVDWSPVKRCMCPNSIFKKWVYANNAEKRRKLAGLIANLPWKPKRKESGHGSNHRTHERG